MANYGGKKTMRSPMITGKPKRVTPDQKKRMKVPTFKNCASCPTPAACRRAGRCLKKRMMGQR
jgi:hypothetical protein